MGQDRVINGNTRYFDGSSIELISDLRPVSQPMHIFFDFDGTISLIREGWQKIMSELIVEILLATGSEETESELIELAREFIAETTGIQTIYQMIQLAEEVAKRGAKPEEPLDYKYEFNQRLLKHIAQRRDSLTTGTLKTDALTVPNVHTFLQSLIERDVTLYLASGTDIEYVREEASLLGVDRYFGDNMYGAQKNYRSFSKKIIVEQIIEKSDIPGNSLVGFGDGFVDMEMLKNVGGLAGGVASDESGISGGVDDWKRNRLIQAGADIVIPDYRDASQLLSFLRL